MSLDTLVKYGSEFQTKCVVALLNDRQFLEQSMDVVNPAYFESDANKWVVEKILWYFSTYKTLPTVLVLKREEEKIDVKFSVLKTGVVEQLKSIFNTQKSNPDDLKYVQNELLTFCRNQALKQAVLKSADLLQKGDYDSIKVLIDKAMHAGQERNIGHNWIEDLDSRLNKISRNVVATPWQCINDLLDGGLGAGELGCIVAPSGIGKTWILSAIGAAAIKAGKTVAHYTFELSENYVGTRYDSIFTGIEPNKVCEHPEIIRRVMDGLQGKLFVKYFPTRSVTINAISAHYQRLCNLGYPPDLVIIDYADLMRSASKADARHEELGFIHEEIRGFLGENKIPGWTASQSQRSSLQDDVVEADKIAGAYSKIMTDDFVMSASRKVADKMTNTARVHVIKNRFGPDGLTFPAEMNLAHGLINIFDPDSAEGKMIKSKIASGEGALKHMLAKKFIEVNEPSQP